MRGVEAKEIDYYREKKLNQQIEEPNKIELYQIKR